MYEDEIGTKVVLLGEEGVGKTCLIDRYINNTFNENTPSSIAASFHNKTINYNKKDYLFTIWDTCGKQVFRPLTKIFLKNVRIIILVYDITNKNTFLELQFWLDYILDALDGNIDLLLVGNKHDLRDKRQIKEADAIKFADTINAQFAEVNAKEPSLWNEFLDNALCNYLKK